MLINIFFFIRTWEAIFEQQQNLRKKQYIEPCIKIRFSDSLFLSFFVATRDSTVFPPSSLPPSTHVVE
jgi:hypothetical protein